ncbi:hypothetical protein HRR81_004005 [Exophiala dermatitidis]|nr:hypothetical protein HRR73_006795 [Exophiala dermatitidis]KAJ4545589.1 hypothetical protein HRR78_006311 [Exophiala dermatitidis]KAJ4575868.1 hypothetical protein HRR82_006161 [Exophiala dermatitidis]KAJ4576117.1 hypothetical protein HRR81_004005 [Exophiala dermatitidis]KAJ4616228.1 hypothetical protein HRR85_003092 [Exophiala dermatitidis]
MADHALSRPGTAPGTSYDRTATATTASFVYDNGTGRLDPRLVQEQGLPSCVKTTDQLAAYLRLHGHAEWSPVSSSHYSTDFTVPSRSHSLHHTKQSLRGPPTNITPSYAYYGGVSSNALIAGLSRRFVAPTIVHTLPGTTRKHEKEGYWLARGTLRRVPAERSSRTGKGRWKKSKEAAIDSGKKFVETSGWYDD